MSVKKRVLQIAVFLVIMFLTFYALFSGRDSTSWPPSSAPTRP